MLDGYKSYGFAGALILKGALALLGDAPMPTPVTFDNVDIPRPAPESGGTDVLLGGAVASLRRAIEKRGR